MSDDQRTPEATLKRFITALSHLNVTMLTAVRVSEGAMGVDHTGRQNRALYLFAKLIAHCMSIMSIADLGRPRPDGVGLMDHSSIAALGRVVVDCSIMTMYISEPSLGASEWRLRRAVLCLHELVNRKRFLTALGDGLVPFFDSYASNKAELRAEITELVEKTGRDKILSDLTSGQKVFLDGSRGAAREAGWNDSEYEFYQSYLSNWVHSHPVSFMRADEQGISFTQPSPFQLDFCATVIEMVTSVVADVTERIAAFTGSRSRDPLG